jgi:hypothetical protein
VGYDILLVNELCDAILSHWKQGLMFLIYLNIFNLLFVFSFGSQDTCSFVKVEILTARKKILMLSTCVFYIADYVFFKEAQTF